MESNMGGGIEEECAVNVQWIRPCCSMIRH